MDTLAVIPSANAVGGTTHAMRVPVRNSRGTIRCQRLARKQWGSRPARSKEKSEIISTGPLYMVDFRPNVIRKVSLWHSESGAIEMVSLPLEDITLPLIHVKGILRAAIDDLELSACLIISSEQAEQITFIIDQLLAHSHLAAAASLSRGSQQFAVAKERLNTSMQPGVSSPDNATQEFYAQSSEGILMIKGASRKKHQLNSLWTMQSLWKKTPWGTIKAEIYLIGDHLYSEILCFRVRFSPDRQLSNTGVIIDYTSHHIKSIFRLDNQPSLPDQQPSDVIDFIDYTAQWYLTKILFEHSSRALSLTHGVLFKQAQTLLCAPHHLNSSVRKDRQEPSQKNQALSFLWMMIEEISYSIQSLPVWKGCLTFPSYQQVYLSRLWEFIQFAPYPARLLVGRVGFYFRMLEVESVGLIAARDTSLESAWHLRPVPL